MIIQKAYFRFKLVENWKHINLALYKTVLCNIDYSMETVILIVLVFSTNSFDKSNTATFGIIIDSL